MMTWVAVGAVLLAAQGQQQDPVESRVDRYKQQLNLTEEQIPKIREIVKKQIDDMKAVLTDEQKQRLEGGGQGGRGGNNGQGNAFGNFRGGWLPPTDQLKTSVGLTDDQVTKVNEIRDANRQELRNFFQGRGRRGQGNQGGQNLAQDFQAFQEKSKEETKGKIVALLTDEQKPKFEDALKAFAANQPQPGQGFGGQGTRGGTLDERVGRVIENLKITDTKESDAIKSLVKKVMEVMDKLDSYNRETRTKIDETARNSNLSDDAVGEKISEIMKGHVELEKELTAARKALTEVVTNRQELELLRRGVLR
jgi:Spy/CpxP family protein refolding chaperone